MNHTCMAEREQLRVILYVWLNSRTASCNSPTKRERVAKRSTVTMNLETSLNIQQECLAQMRKGLTEPMERMDCFTQFETTNPSIELVKEFYDLWAADYATDMKVVQYMNPVHVAAELATVCDDRNARILDVGAGTGVGGMRLVENGFTNMDATDGSTGMLIEAKKLGIYKNIISEVLVKGQPMLSVKPETYDVICSSGSFYPFHLHGHHLKCFIDCVKTGGLLVLFSCPHDDKTVGLRPVFQELAAEGVVQVVKEKYIPSGYREDGTVFVLKKLKRYSETTNQ
jgi:predicted TPR repeat methyltransferase